MAVLALNAVVRVGGIEDTNPEVEKQEHGHDRSSSRPTEPRDRHGAKRCEREAGNRHHPLRDARVAQARNRIVSFL